MRGWMYWKDKKIMEICLSMISQMHQSNNEIEIDRNKDLRVNTPIIRIQSAVEKFAH